MTMALGKLWTTLKKQQNPLEHKNQGWLPRKVQEIFYPCHPILQSGAAQHKEDAIRRISLAWKRDQDDREIGRAHV